MRAERQTYIGCLFITPRYESNNDSEWGYYGARLESVYFAVCIWGTCGFLVAEGGRSDRKSDKVEIYKINS